MRIGVFDSGVGGLSVLESIQRRLPQASFFYCCDSAHFPYGTKSDADVIAFTTSASRRFVSEAALDLLVIACNTASTVSLPSVRAAVSCPVVGVVPAVKPAAKHSKTRCIGVLATKAAARSDYLKELIEQFADGCEVRLCGSSKLVEMAENKIRGIPVDLVELKVEVADFFRASSPKVDTVVLGCTHFPLLRAELQQIEPWPIAWIDSGDAIAERVALLMTNHASKVEHSAEETGIGFCTGAVDSLWMGDIPEFVQKLGLRKWMRLKS